MAKKKGFSVSVCRSGARSIEVASEAGDSVADAIGNAGLNLKTSEIVQVNGDELDRDELDEVEVTEGDRIILVKNIQGGQLTI